MSEQPTRVYGFDGPHAFLSNFAPSPIEYEGVAYPTVEHAFAACKTFDRQKRLEIARAATPGQAKRLGQAVPLRPDWEAVKTDVMLALVRLKFEAHPALLRQLIATGSAELVEANHWHDRVWGVDRATGVGENRLGIILMIVRTELGAIARSNGTYPTTN
jgi:hypothetical protein